MKKLISLSFAALTLGTMFVLPARANNSEVERFCSEYGTMTNTEDITLMIQNYIGEIEDITPEDLLALYDVMNRVNNGESLSSICDD